MKSTVTLSPEGNTIQLFIPAKLGRYSGRKVILSPTGQPVNPDRNEEADASLFNALIRAHRWQGWMINGKIKNINEIATEEGIRSPSFVSRILRLTLLAPDIQEAILTSSHPAYLTLEDFKDPFPQLWTLQRKQFGFEANKVKTK